MMPRSFFTVTIALALAGCEYVDPDLIEDGDGGALDDDSADDDGEESSDDGEDEAITEGVDLACTDMEISWELETAWESGHWAWDIVSGRLYDSNDDGVVNLADSMSLVSYSGDEDGHFIDHFDYLDDPSTADRVVEGGWRAYSRLGDLDGEPGAEVGVGWYVYQEDFDRATVYGAHLDVEHELPDNLSHRPWFADVDDDGDRDLVMVGRAIDVADGSEVLTWPQTNSSVFSVAVDLDLDGSEELLTATKYHDEVSLGILSDSGTVDPCLVIPDWYVALFAVGDLDGDPEGEFVIATLDELVVCDSDGTQLHHLDIELEQPSMVAIADLDGDLDAEILVTGAYWPDHPRYPMLALDHELNLLWEDDREGWAPFTVADLDADGDHEILQLDAYDGLRILDGDGSVITTWPLPKEVEAVSWQAQPTVVDVDLDGLGEIVVPLSESVVLDTPAGGFPAPGAATGWSGLDHFPGLMAADGSLDTTGAPWLTPGGNAWQGHGTCVSTSD